MKNINDLRNIMFDVLQGVKDGSIEIEKAKVANEVAQVLINTAKVEVDYIKHAGGDSSAFLEDRQIQGANPLHLTNEQHKSAKTLKMADVPGRVVRMG